MIQPSRVIRAAGAAVLLTLAACASGNNPAQATGDPNATAPATTSDPGTRYLDPAAEPIGGVTVETPPVDGAWAAGQTSIARPAPGSVPAGSVPAGSVPAGSVPAGSVPAGSVPAGSPDGMAAPRPSSGDLPAPNRRNTPPPPPLR